MYSIIKDKVISDLSSPNTKVDIKIIEDPSESKFQVILTDSINEVDIIDELVKKHNMIAFDKSISISEDNIESPAKITNTLTQEDYDYIYIALTFGIKNSTDKQAAECFMSTRNKIQHLLSPSTTFNSRMISLI